MCLPDEPREGGNEVDCVAVVEQVRPGCGPPWTPGPRWASRGGPWKRSVCQAWERSDGRTLPTRGRRSTHGLAHLYWRGRRQLSAARRRAPQRRPRHVESATPAGAGPPPRAADPARLCHLVRGPASRGLHLLSHRGLPGLMGTLAHRYCQPGHIASVQSAHDVGRPVRHGPGWPAIRSECKHAPSTASPSTPKGSMRCAMWKRSCTAALRIIRANLSEALQVVSPGQSYPLQVVSQR
jgi:hypothetical protein